MIVIIIIIIININININIFFPSVWSLHFGGKQWNDCMTQGGELGSLFVLMSLAIVTTRREKREGFCTLCFCPPPLKCQPRPQGFSLKKWVGREKALASAGHMSPRTP